MALAGASGCGSQGVQVSKSDPDYKGAALFAERCAGCHTLSAAGAEGSAENSNKKEPTDGPNLDKRQEKVSDVLWAIRNGGFSGQIMPENLVVGSDAQAVAKFVARCAGKDGSDC